MHAWYVNALTVVQDPLPLGLDNAHDLATTWDPGQRRAVCTCVCGWTVARYAGAYLPATATRKVLALGREHVADVAAAA